MVQRLSYMRESPSEPLITVIDYTRNDADISVKLLKDERAEDRDSDVLWDEHISRAARSGGRMELHLLRILDGNKTRRIMFPQRSESSVLHDGLMRIFSDVSEAGDGLEKIWQLLMTSCSAVGIH